MIRSIAGKETDIPEGVAVPQQQLTGFGYANQELRLTRHALEQEETRKHPRKTKQAFDFWMHL